MAVPTPEQIKKNAKLTMALIKFGKKEYTQENIMYYFDKGNMAGVHPKYIKSGAPRMVNVSSRNREMMQKAFDANNEKEWAKWNKKGKDEKNLAKAVKVLGIDAKHKAGIIDVMVAYKMKGASAAKKALGPLLKKAQMKVEVEKVLANLKKIGM